MERIGESLVLETRAESDSPAEAFANPSRSLAALVTPSEGRTLPVHRWFLYPHSFSPGLVRELLDAFRLKPGSLVYDPFAGAGTTLRTAQEEGYSAVGLDMLPLSVLVSNTKTTNYDSEALARAWGELKRRVERVAKTVAEVKSDIPLVGRAFSPETAAVLARIRMSIAKQPPALHRDFFLVALARLIEEVSMAVKSGGWPRLVDRRVDPEGIVPRFAVLVEAMLGDVANLAPREAGHWRCHRGDSRRMPHGDKYGAVITSPPYLNRHDYTRVFAVEHAVLFGTSQDRLIALRRQLLRSHVEARPPQPVHGYAIPQELADILPALKAAAHTDRRVYTMITGYFEDMFSVLRAVKSRLSPKGYVGFVLGDVRFAGIMVPVEAAVRQLGEQAGMHWVATWRARERGNSAQQMKVHGREPAHECVIIWQAN